MTQRPTLAAAVVMLLAAFATAQVVAADDDSGKLEQVTIAVCATAPG